MTKEGLKPSAEADRVTLIRRLYWDRPLSQHAADHARERMTAYDEDKVLLDSAVKAADGFFTTFFVSPYSKYIARWAARRGFMPNQVTTVSVLIGLADCEHRSISWARDRVRTESPAV